MEQHEEIFIPDTHRMVKRYIAAGMPEELAELIVEDYFRAFKYIVEKRGGTFAKFEKMDDNRR